MRKSVKGIIGAGMLGGIAYGAWRAWNARMPDRATTLDWTAAPFPFPPVPRPVPTTAPPPAHAATAEPHDDGSCPASYPIKAKLTSGIYHEPGGLNYARTKADRCYADGSAAEADGLRPSKI